MKITTFILSSLIVTPFAFGQAKSDVVGYETLTKNVGVNYLGLRLMEKATASGSISAVSGATVTLDVAPTVAAGVSLFEVTSGLANGTVIEVASVAGSSVTLTQDMSAELAVSDTFTIRPAHTLSSVFGADNSAGLASAGDFVSSDQVWIPDGAGDFNKYAYLIANPFTGQSVRWVDSEGSEVDPNSVALNYIDGVVIIAKEAGSFVVDGTVKTTPTSYAINLNVNYLGGVYPVGSTLESAFGDDNSAGLTSAGDFVSSDQVWLPDGTGNFNMYAYLVANPFTGQAARWADSTGSAVDASSIEITPGMIIIKAGSDSNVSTNPPANYSSL